MNHKRSTALERSEKYFTERLENSIRYSIYFIYFICEKSHKVWFKKIEIAFVVENEGYLTF